MRRTTTWRLSGDTGEAFEKICDRFRGIVSELGLEMDIETLLSETRAAILAEATPDFCASRGEYLSARIMAELWNVPFIDARDVVKFGADGRLDSERTYSLLGAALKGKKRAVVSGFYGEDENGKVKTFSRGGSDISGAIVARARGGGSVRKLDGRQRVFGVRSPYRGKSHAHPRPLL